MEELMKISFLPLISALSLSLLMVVCQAQGVARTSAEVAQEFLDSLDSDSRTRANLSFNSPKWQEWTSAPLGEDPHHGVLIEELDNIQLSLVFTLLKNALSQRGYKKALSTIASEDIADDSDARGSAKYFITIFGTPAESEPWGWQFDGHHLSLNVVFVGDQMSVTPIFIGIEPAEYADESFVLRPLGDEQDKATALMEALSIEQKKAAMLDPGTRDMVAGPGKDNFVPEVAGISAAELTDGQEVLLLKFIEEWVNNLKEPFATNKMAEVQASLADTYFAWSGIAIHGGVVYYRVQSPILLIEFGYEVDLNTVGQANHIHSIFRDPTNDYGKLLLGD